MVVVVIARRAGREEDGKIKNCQCLCEGYDGVSPPSVVWWSFTFVYESSPNTLEVQHAAST